MAKERVSIGCVYCTGAGTNEENRQKLRNFRGEKKNCTELDSYPSILACKPEEVGHASFIVTRCLVNLIMAKIK